MNTDGAGTNLDGTNNPDDPANGDSEWLNARDNPHEIGSDEENASRKDATQKFIGDVAKVLDGHVEELDNEQVSYSKKDNLEVAKDLDNKVGERDNGKEGTLSDSNKDNLYTLSFENLTVYVPGIQKSCCNCLDNPFSYLAQEYGGVSIKEQDPFYALDGISGYLKSGELCLVLGGDDQGKSTLLRALSGRLNASDDLSGTVLLNGIPMPRSNRGWKKLCSYVSASDATHSAVLTVRETFTFAAKCAAYDNGETEEQIDEKVESLLSNLGLSHVADTVVGDENLRGISGGQKRRVTIGEMMLNESCRFMCLENITDGLSSADSISLIEKFSSACHDYKSAAFISLLQPSDEMIQLFDKLLVLTSQGLAYFGPVDQNVLGQIFLEETTSGINEVNDGSICDLVLKHSLSSSPDDEIALVKRYANSDIAKQTVVELSQIRTRAPPARDRNIKKILPEKKVTKSAWYLFQIISARRIKLINRNAVTWTRILIAIVFGVIIGSLFSALKNNLSGALGRTGYVFLNCFLVLMLSAAVTIPSSFRERVTLFKHRSAEFYGGRIAYLAQLVTDCPLSILEAILLSCISYFWVGMSNDAGDFFYFMGTLVALEFAGQALGRLLCAVYQKQVTANAMSSVVILIFGTVGGFMPAYGSITPILRWISWITPVSYAFEGLMINEFHGSTIDPILTMGETGAGSITVPGDTWIGGYNLPRIASANPEAIRIWNIFMVFLFAIFYDLLGFYFIERTRIWFHNQTRRPQSTVKHSFTMEAPLKVKMANSSEQVAQKEASDWPRCITIRDLSYEVPLKPKMPKLNPMPFIRKRLVRMGGREIFKETPDQSQPLPKTLTLLHSINARFRCDRMTALMGTSGAGKTTLMDVIAGYKTGGSIHGDILIDGQPKDPAVWKRISGYAEQNDILNPYLTVLETLRFTANCRLPASVNKIEIIDQIFELMNLNEWRNYVVGREIEGEGLPKHARKRLTIAIQLVIQPKILFLDEPTTGLGTNAASLVISAVRSATDTLGLITVATIHQPSKVIWDTFDDVLLLGRSNCGGRAAYMGESGQNSETVLNHFATILGDTPSKRCNPADFCLGVLDRMDAGKAEEIFMKSDLGEGLKVEIEKDHENRKPPPPNAATKSTKNVFREFLLLTVRQIIVQWRNPSYCLMRIISSMVMSFYIGLLFWGDKTSLNGAVFSIGAIFFLVFVLVIPMQAAVVPLVEDRAVLYRETVSGTYSRISYGLGQLFADQPFHILNTMLMFVFFYFLVGFRLEGGQVGYFILMLYLANWVIQSLGQLYALATPNEESANGLGGLSVILSVILMGFLITVSMMPAGWVWAYWANLFHYMLQGLVTNELANNKYFIDLSGVFPEFQFNSSNATSIVAFGSSVGPLAAKQITRFASLAVNNNTIGVNEDEGILGALIKCTLDEECFAGDDEIASAFLNCYMVKLLGSPPCKEEFNNALKSVNDSGIVQCLESARPPTGVEDSLPSEDIWTDEDITKLEVQMEETDSNSRLEMLICLMSALLPPDTIDGLKRLIKIITGIIMIVIPIFENGGIYLPGELILLFFGWAEIDTEEGVIAPYKWWYCMGSVVIFLGAIELFKLFACRFIVWTKR